MLRGRNRDIKAPGYRSKIIRLKFFVVTAIWVGLILSTYLSCAKVGPIVESILPDGIFQLSKKTWPILGATYVLAGAAHFALPEGFDGKWCRIKTPSAALEAPGFEAVPRELDWRFCEILGGLGTLSLLFDSDSSLGKASAFGLFALTIAVTPANTYMFTNKFARSFTSRRDRRDDGIIAFATFRQRGIAGLSVDRAVGHRDWVERVFVLARFFTRRSSTIGVFLARARNTYLYIGKEESIIACCNQ